MFSLLFNRQSNKIPVVKNMSGSITAIRHPSQSECYSDKHNKRRMTNDEIYDAKNDAYDEWDNRKNGLC